MTVSTQIFPNVHQGAKKSSPVTVCANDETHLPKTFKRLGYSKMQFLITEISLVNLKHHVLEMFAGSGLGTSILLERTKHVTSLDLHYDVGKLWWFDYKNNIQSERMPEFVAADARQTPFENEMFDVVLTPDSPRDAKNPSEEQKQIFVAAMNEAHRVLKHDGIFAATTFRDWLDDHPFNHLKIIEPSSRRLQFKHDIVYVRCVK